MKEVDLLADLALWAVDPGLLRKADLTVPGYVGWDPSNNAVSQGIAGTGNWNLGIAVLGLHAIMHGNVDNNPPPGKVAYSTIPASQKYSDYGEIYNGAIPELKPEIWEPTIDWMNSVIQTLHLMVTYQPPDKLTGVD